ncbi:hypothetical protein [Lactococcus lactis]|uniref:hypothetical protein n=1 Tax=Lactococcus lactis TaxID=1358 RepID=UPI000571E1CE|nr:hypothetical protein [Lactococcus lactis]
MDRERISYYKDTNHITVGNMKLIQLYIEELKKGKLNENLEEVIESYNVYKYLSENKYLEYEIYISDIRRFIGTFLSKNKLNSLVKEYIVLKDNYKHNFWGLISEFNIVKSISVQNLERFISEADVSIYSLLSYKKIVDKFENLLKRIFLLSPKNFEYILDSYHNSFSSKIYIPQSLSLEEIEQLARRYCELDGTNLTYLEMIVKWPNQNELKISAKTRLKAKRSYEKQKDEFFKTSGKSLYKLGVSFKRNLKTDSEIENNKAKDYIQINFNKSWLESNLDYPTILNNYIYFFSFFNLWGQFSILDSPYRKEGLIDFLGVKFESEYRETITFKHKKGLFLIIFVAYFDFLSFNNVDLEEVFEGYYDELLSNEYGLDEFFFSASNSKSTYYERCKSLIPEMESVLKQFELFREEGEIDKELLEIEAEGISYKSIKSFNSKKYVYFASKEMEGLTSLIFDWGSSLSLTQNQNSMLTFYERVSSTLYEDEIEGYQKHHMSKLIESNFIGVNIFNQVYFKNKEIIDIYKNIWEFGYVSTFNFSNEMLLLLDEEVNKGHLKYDDNLFSKQEIDYISYMLDSKKFSNSKKLRNGLIHGASGKKNEKEYKKYYIELLLIFLLYTFKINEELNNL